MTTHPYERDPSAFADPHASDYRQRDLGPHDGTGRTHDVTATQELLDWMRFRGYSAQSVSVGAGGVQIVGLVDDYPRKTPPKAPTEADVFDDERLRR